MTRIPTTFGLAALTLEDRKAIGCAMQAKHYTIALALIQRTCPRVRLDDLPLDQIPVLYQRFADVCELHGAAAAISPIAGALYRLLCAYQAGVLPLGALHRYQKAVLAEGYHPTPDDEPHYLDMEP